MKKSLKLFACALSLGLAASTIVGCGPRVSDDEKIDTSKTQLYVYNFGGGYGSAWLDSVKARFEADYADYKLNGKTGVEVKVRSQKKVIEPTDNLKSMDQEIFFTESTNYISMQNSGQMLDITDMLKEDLTEKYGESGSILDKFYDEQKDYYNVNEKYYAVPHYFTPFGISYNKEVFEEGYYIAAAMQNKETQATSTYDATLIETEYNAGKTSYMTNSIEFCKPNAGRTNLSAGPDGKTGTFDDGLPATYAEFYLLCDKLSGTTYAIHWAGAPFKEYFPMLLSALAANNEGKEQMNLNFDYRGEKQATTLIKNFDANGNPVLEDATTITSANGYELARQAGKYYAVDFLNTIVANKSWYKQDSGMLFDAGHAHTTAQREFITAGKTTAKKMAMFIDGSWWESEATDTFKELATEKDPNLAKDKRSFGYLPLPHPTANHIGKSTLYDMYSAIGFIKSSIAEDKIPLAKAFLQYCNTNVSLQEYSQVTSTLKALKYEITGTYYDNMTEYGKSLYQLKNASDIVFPISSDSFFLSNEVKFKYDVMFSGKKTDGGNLTSPAQLYPNNAVTAQEYYEYMKRYLQNTWSN